VSVTSTLASGSDAFPTSPIETVTPGDVCDHADEIRYPERIVYCRRSVGSSLKENIIDMYDQRFGFKIRQTGRSAFKIDHYIPLCMGGSNDAENLWPQHKTIYQYTDPLEELACKKMAAGTLLQARAIEIIKAAKANPPQAQIYIDEVSKL